METVEETRARKLFELMCQQASFKFEYPNLASHPWADQSERTKSWFRIISKPEVTA